MISHSIETGISCTKCNTPVVYKTGRSLFFPCTTCGSEIYVEVFPSLFRKSMMEERRDTAKDGDISTCFFHNGRKAHVICDCCGRFICSLCDVVISYRHLCPMCFDSKRRKKKIKSLTTHRLLFDQIAFFLAIVPSITLILTVVTAPVSLFLCIRYWNYPISILPRSNIRFVIAGIASFTQIALWITFLFSITL